MKLYILLVATLLATVTGIVVLTALLVSIPNNLDKAKILSSGGINQSFAILEHNQQVAQDIIYSHTLLQPYLTGDFEPGTSYTVELSVLANSTVRKTNSSLRVENSDTIFSLEVSFEENGLLYEKDPVFTELHDINSQVGRISGPRITGRAYRIVDEFKNAFFQDEKGFNKSLPLYFYTDYLYTSDGIDASGSKAVSSETLSFIDGQKDVRFHIYCQALSDESTHLCDKYIRSMRVRINKENQ